MKFFNRFRRKTPASVSEPEQTVPLSVDLYDTIVLEACRSGVDPATVIHDLLQEAVERRRLSESAQCRWQNLSPREREITRLVYARLSNREIAGRLCLAPDTVKNHLTSALHKLGLRHKAQLWQALEGIDLQE